MNDTGDRCDYCIYFHNKTYNGWGVCLKAVARRVVSPRGRGLLRFASVAYTDRCDDFQREPEGIGTPDDRNSP